MLSFYRMAKKTVRQAFAFFSRVRRGGGCKNIGENLMSGPKKTPTSILKLHGSTLLYKRQNEPCPVALKKMPQAPVKRFNEAGKRFYYDVGKILIDMGMSHEILDYLCKLAIEEGALGAKVTGGGRGGYMVALTPGERLQDTVASAFEKEGYQLIRATIGGNC